MNILSKETGIITGLILCTLRHYSESQSMETVKLVNEFYDKGVVGFDIAADEFMDSRWATQVGNRAVEVTEIIRTGEHQ